jgi:hypothetical protein
MLDFRNVLQCRDGLIDSVARFFNHRRGQYHRMRRNVTTESSDKRSVRRVGPAGATLGQQTTEVCKTPSQNGDYLL